MVDTIYIDTEYIKLDQLLKHANIVGSGGEAKIIIQEGEIFLNNGVVLQRGKKIKDGDIVQFRDIEIKVIKR